MLMEPVSPTFWFCTVDEGLTSGIATACNCWARVRWFEKPWTHYDIINQLIPYAVSREKLEVIPGCGIWRKKSSVNFDSHDTGPL